MRNVGVSRKLKTVDRSHQFRSERIICRKIIEKEKERGRGESGTVGKNTLGILGRRRPSINSYCCGPIGKNRKLVYKGGEPRKGSLEIKDLHRTPSHPEISRTSKQDSPSSIGEEDHIRVREEGMLPVDLALWKPYWWSERKLYDS